MVKKVKILDFARRSMVCRSTLGKVERMSEKWNGSAAPIITLPDPKKLMDVLPLSRKWKKGFP